MRMRVFLAMFVVSIVSACSDQSPAAQDDFTGQLSPAVRELVQEAAKQTRERGLEAGTWGRYGQVLLANNLLAPAARAYERARDLEPDNAEWSASLAIIYRQESRLDEAEVAVSKAVTSAPQNARILFLAGSIYEELGRYDEALAALDAVRQLIPESFEADFVQGRIFMNQGRYEDAELSLERAMRNAPRSAQIRSSLVRLAAASPGLEVAVPSEDSALNDWPVVMRLPFSEKLLPYIRRPEALREYIAIFVRSNDNPRAEEFLERLTLYYPERANPQEWVDLAHLQATGGDLTAAEATYRQCLEYHLNAVNAYLGLADLMFMKNNNEEAREYYGMAKEFVEAPRQEARVLQGLGRLEARNKDLPHALESMLAAEALWPESGLIQMDLVLILADLGRFDEASAHLRRAEELGAPATEELKRNLVGARARQGQRPK